VQPVSTAIERAVIETVERLRALGHEVVEFPVHDLDQVVSMYYQMIGGDGFAQGTTWCDCIAPVP
jgi:Asp-tRNA(Asn)/Glu-tRNA(Gln) amidotransferase A subunit family amidase